MELKAIPSEHRLIPFRSECTATGVRSFRPDAVVTEWQGSMETNGCRRRVVLAPAGHGSWAVVIAGDLFGRLTSGAETLGVALLILSDRWIQPPNPVVT